MMPLRARPARGPAGRYSLPMRIPSVSAALMCIFFLSACGGGRPAERREGVVDAHLQIQQIYGAYSLFTKDHELRLPKSMDELGDYAVSQGKDDPRDLVSPYANDEDPRGYAWMPRKEPDITKVWDETLLVYDAAAEAQGYPAINVLIGEGGPVLIDRDELRRVMREHGLKPSTTEIEAKKLGVKQSIREMYPLK